MKGNKFWLPLSSKLWYQMEKGKTVVCFRKVYIFGICVAAWDVFIPD